ncbi:DUF927 domain-containing protein [Pararhodobacter oceanensis]|uniref:DUF927 domain-containing protein n=1 Tax=Pararhodobacter oceanensis TaxID=2172121 RepID=A0A2T8HS27_9RHOB|nr:DUF927 domain-containing protein [Pararhodobacter oceanensis]PVH28238.1 hypothetical protein DDE20_14140 [Pararhodobacter oceanensis]
MTYQIPAPTVRVLRNLPEDAELVRAIPAQFPMPDLRQNGAAPSATYEYRNSDASLAAIVARYDYVDGKRISPFTVWKSPNGRMEWYNKGLLDARPLYRLPHLLADNAKPVLISEGEKCADAATCFEDYVSITWMGGSNAWSKTDFTPLARREIIILPDLDSAGENAANKIAEILREIGASSVRMLDIEALAKACEIAPVAGFDIADAIAEGLDAPRFYELLAQPGMLKTTDMLPTLADATPAALPGDPVLREVQERYNIQPEDIPGVFSLSSNGVIKHDFDRNGFPVEIYAGSPLVILGRTIEKQNGETWGYLVALRTPAARWVRRTIPGKLLAGDGKELRELLADAGAIIPQCRAGRQALAEYIGYAQHGPICELATRPGWYGDSFALPHQIIKPSESKAHVLLDMGERKHYLAQAGSMEGWQELAKLAESNSRAAFSICVALAAPMLQPMDLSGGGFHFFGQSSRGKTTLLTAGGSVWGGGGNDGFVRNWRMTVNGAEGTLADHNDLLLPLDELTMIPPELAAELFYMLGDGHGKIRAERDGTARASTQSRVLVLSSGENTAAHQISLAPNKVRMTGGLSVRMIDIPIEHTPGESFEDLCGFKTAGLLAEQMSELAKTHYGHAGPAFVQKIADYKSGFVSVAKELIDMLVEELVDPEDDPQVRRVATRFGIVAAAGHLARQTGVLPWREDSAFDAVKACFSAWKANRGGGASQEEREALAHVKAFFETNGRARFERLVLGANGKLTRASDFVVRDRCGYFEETENDETVFYVRPESFKQHICGSHSPDLVVKIAKKHGALLLGENGRSQKKMRLPDYPNGTRVYALRPDLLP